MIMIWKQGGRAGGGLHFLTMDHGGWCFAVVDQGDHARGNTSLKP
jgi:hypothetical protein